MYEHSKQGAVDVITGDEPLNLDAVDRVSRLLEDCIGRGQPRIVLDFGGVALIDSAGLELLLDARQRCGQRGGRLQLAALSPLCHDILDVTGLASEFETFDDVLSAVGSFAR
ncbi:MAG TPA: STAS domain-containing protein [Planctomycetaceae bacterium]|nr:STAS domain-containing protein [Planctomycetaceae bacterium]